jgi:hypothetical protein
MVVHPRVVQGDLKVVSMSGVDSALGSRVSESGSESTASDNPHVRCGGEDQAALAPGLMMTRQHLTGRRHSGAAAEAAKLSSPAPAADVGVGAGDNIATSTWTGADEAVRLGSAATRAASVVVDDDSTVALRYQSPTEPRLSVSPSTSGSPQSATRRRISSRARTRAGSSARFESSAREGSSARSSAGPPAVGVEVKNAVRLTGSHVMMGPSQLPPLRTWLVRLLRWSVLRH